MGELTREMTVNEEISALDIDTETKDRILAKLKREYLSRNEYESRLAKEKEHFCSLSTRGEETNIALVDACVGLAKVVQIQLKGRY